MKYLLLFFVMLFGLYGQILQAQTTKTDSLEHTLKNTKGDTIKVQIMTQLAWLYLTSIPEKCKEYALKGIQLAKIIQYTKGQIVLLNYLGDYYRRKGEYAKGVEYATLSLRVAETNKDSLGMADAYRLLGMIHSFSLHEYEEALKYHNLALPIYLKSKDKKRIISLYSNLAWVFFMMNQKIPLANDYTEKAIALLKEVNDDQLMSWCLNSKGLISIRKFQLDSAIIYFNQSNELAHIVNDKAVEAYNYSLMGKVLIQQKKYTEAINILTKNLPLMKQVNVKGVVSEVFNDLAVAYSTRKQYDSAYHYYTSHIVLKDSLHNWETSQKIAIIQAEYAKERREAKIVQLEKEKQRFIFYMIGIVVGFLVIFFLIVRNNLHRRKTNHLLQEKNKEIALQNEELAQSQEELASHRDILESQNKELEELNQIKDKLFAIIGHDLRSPINSLKGLIELFNTENISSEEFKVFSNRLKDSVEYTHFTLNNLLEWANNQLQGLKSEPMPLNLFELAKENLNFLGHLASSKQIQTFNFIQENTEVFADPDQIHLVLRNLISNAIKFTKQGGTITLKSNVLEDFTEISVIDTGIGIEKTFLAKLFNKSDLFSTQGTAKEKGTGLGLLLCKDFVEKNKGTIWVESELGKGSTFTFTLPNLPPKA